MHLHINTHTHKYLQVEITIQEIDICALISVFPKLTPDISFFAFKYLLVSAKEHGRVQCLSVISILYSSKPEGVETEGPKST